MQTVEVSVYLVSAHVRIWLCGFTLRLERVGEFDSDNVQIGRGAVRPQSAVPRVTAPGERLQRRAGHLHS